MTDLTQADPSKRSDVAFYADIISEASFVSTHLVVLNFGSPSIAVADNQLDLQVTATDGGADSVILRARIQKVARAPSSEFEFGKPNAVETAWSPESPPVRVRYGKSAEVQVTDQDQRKWKVTLHPNRMQGAISSQ